MRVFMSVFLSVVLVFGLCCGISYFAVGSGDDAPPPVDSETPVVQEPSDAPIGGEFHAWIEHEEHVYDPNLMQLRIRLFPDAERFPGLGTADVYRLDDMVVQATVRVDVSVPLWNAQVADRPESHIQREKARGREALEFCRRAVLNASGLVVVSPRYSENDRLVHCSVMLIDDAGDRTDLRELLVENGFGSVKAVDWGRRVPR